MNIEKLRNKGLDMLMKQVKGQRINEGDAEMIMTELLNHGDRDFAGIVTRAWTEALVCGSRAREFFLGEWGLCDPEQVDKGPERFSWSDKRAFRAAMVKRSMLGITDEITARLEKIIAGDI